MTDPYRFEEEVEGWVSSKELDGGLVRVRITIDASAVTARAEDGKEFRIPWHEVRLEMGGANGRVLFCHAPGKRFSIYSDDRSFERGVEGSGGNEIADQLARLAGERVTTRARHLASCAGCLIVTVAALYWGVRSCFSTASGVAERATSAVVDQVPYSIDEEIGSALAESVGTGLAVVDDPLVLEPLRAMVERLAPHRSLPQATFNVRLVRDATPNAFALPGGYITVFTGLIASAERPEQVAGVLAHEMAHVTRRHQIRRIVQSLGVLIGSEAILGDAQGLLDVGKELFTLATINDYSQRAEAEADAEGIRMLHAAGIDPSGLPEYFAILRDEHGDVSEALSWMSTHPMHAERIRATREQIAELGASDGYAGFDLDWEAVRERARR